jgi:hypothetical protein
MQQGRQTIIDLLNGTVSWPPVVVPFGLDPFGWHGEQESYRDVCDFALDYCTLLPKVYPVSDPLYVGKGKTEVISDTETRSDGTRIRRHELRYKKRTFSMEETQTPGDSSWMVSKRWIENEEDFNLFLGMDDLPPAEPEIEKVRLKVRQVGEHGLPYVEIRDALSIVCQMLPTVTFYIKTVTDFDRLSHLISIAAERVLYIITRLCRETGPLFILRLIGAELAVPPFMSRRDFLRFNEDFYTEAARIARDCGIPAAVHCHGPVREIAGDIWQMGFSIMEPFEPPPRGNLTIAEALSLTNSRGIVLGGVDDVLLNTGDCQAVRNAVQQCLDGARDTGKPYVLSQSATPFFDPLSERAKENLLLFMKLGTAG